MAAVAAVAAGLAMLDDLRDSVIVVARHRDGGHAGNGPAVASPPGDQEMDLPEPLRSPTCRPNYRRADRADGS
jgi:hypothetical protein